MQVQSDNSQVANVLGDYSNAQRIINSQSSCIGIDYQPPTPAPIQHVIGGEDDDDQNHARGGNLVDNHRPQKPRPSIPRPPSHTRLPEDLNLTNRPAKSQKPQVTKTTE
jgi:hypothetical protein